LKFDRAQLECFQTIPIAIIAQAAKTTFKVIKDFNPEIRGHHISKGSHSILIPEGRAKSFHARYQKLLSRWTDENQRHVYVVKKGDSLYSIAERFNLPLRVLAIWNQISLSTHIHPGDELVIYPNKTKQN